VICGNLLSGVLKLTAATADGRVQHPLERRPRKDTEFRIGQRGQGEVDIARIGLA
jgi:hypothetical protein